MIVLRHVCDFFLINVLQERWFHTFCQGLWKCETRNYLNAIQCTEVMNKLLKIAGKDNQMASFSPPSESSASQGALTRGYLCSSDRTGFTWQKNVGNVQRSVTRKVCAAQWNKATAITTNEDGASQNVSAFPEVLDITDLRLREFKMAATGKRLTCIQILSNTRYKEDLLMSWQMEIY